MKKLLIYEVASVGETSIEAIFEATREAKKDKEHCFKMLEYMHQSCLKLFMILVLLNNFMSIN